MNRLSTRTWIATACLLAGASALLADDVTRICAGMTPQEDLQRTLRAAVAAGSDKLPVVQE